MEILPNMHILDLGLYLEKQQTLVFGDFHMGFEEAMIKKGVLIPRFLFNDTIKRLQHILHQLKKQKWRCKKIVLNGDIKHEFGTISDTEWREALKLFDMLSEKCEELILIKGNHDVILEPIAKKRNINLVDQLQLDDVLILHGHQLPKSIVGIKTVIIGNEHPCLTLRDNMRVEKFKCFLKGTWKKKNLIVMPSFNTLTTGTDIRGGNVLSPFLKQDISPFEAYVVEQDKVYYFGKLGKL